MTGADGSGEAPPQQPAQPQPGARPATTVADLRAIVSSRRYRRLLTTRVTGQTGDGVFQAGLASNVLFDPTQQPTALSVALVFSALILPFTIVGPFAGVLLDRWSRRNLLLVANLIRVVLILGCAATVLLDGHIAVLFVLVLATLSVNRFILAGLGASLPHTVRRGVLVTANAMTPTLGTGVYALGLAIGGLIRWLAGAGDVTDAAVLTLGGGLFLLAAMSATRMRVGDLGPDERSRIGTLDAARAVAVGFAEGARHVWQRPVARDAMGAIAAHRFAFGLSVIATVLLTRGHLAPEGVSDAEATEAAVGILLLVGATTAVGALLAAVLTPVATKLLRPWAAARSVAPVEAWIVGALGLAVVVEALFVLGITVTTLALGGFALGLAGQAVKIGVDTQVQTGVEDAYRGRAFAFYDVIYNAATIVAALLAVLVVPDDGYSRVLYGGIAVLYALAALWYGTALRSRTAPPVPPPVPRGATVQAARPRPPR